jgi:hypothetical protein
MVVTFVVFDKLIEQKVLGSTAYYYEGETGNDYENNVK